MVAEAEERGYVFPYLYDETQEVAKAYHAACTPDFFLFDANQELVYRGQLDSSRPDSGIPVTGADLRAALDAVLAGKKPVARATCQPRLQHQVGPGQRAGLLWLIGRGYGVANRLFRSSVKPGRTAPACRACRFHSVR